ADLASRLEALAAEQVTLAERQAALQARHDELRARAARESSLREQTEASIETLQSELVDVQADTDRELDDLRELVIRQIRQHQDEAARIRDELAREHGRASAVLSLHSSLVEGLGGALARRPA